MPSGCRVAADPSTVFREELDDWALLFNPDTGTVFGLNPVGAFVRKHLDGSRTVEELADLVRQGFEDVPPDVEAEVAAFVEELVGMGFAEYRAS
ncbi:MAG: PqqD family peptide modification chaperone [Methanospirillum sp.]